jgi:transcriptional regulator with XRE-family HTH domain
MENDFLHKINIDSLSRETNLSVEEIANLAGISDAKNIGKWAQGKPNGSRPNYNAFVRLFQNGATVETLFGVEYACKKPVEPAPPPHVLNDPEFKESLEDLMVDILKKKGLIK